MDIGTLITILAAVAPSIAPKIAKIMKSNHIKEMDERAFNTVLLGVMVEQNTDSYKEMKSLNRSMNRMLDDMAVVKRRTETLDRVR